MAGSRSRFVTMVPGSATGVADLPAQATASSGCANAPKPSTAVHLVDRGEALYMSAAIAKTHVGHLLTKLNVRDRTHLVIAAYEAGLISRT